MVLTQSQAMPPMRFRAEESKPRFEKEGKRKAGTKRVEKI